MEDRVLLIVGSLDLVLLDGSLIKHFNGYIYVKGVTDLLDS